MSFMCTVHRNRQVKTFHAVLLSREEKVIFRPILEQKLESRKFFLSSFYCLFSLFLNLLSQPPTTREEHSVQPGHGGREFENVVEKEIFYFHFFPRITFIDPWYLMIKNDVICGYVCIAY